MRGGIARSALLLSGLAVAGCGGGSSSPAAGLAGPTPGAAAAAPATALRLPAGFAATVIATVTGARELAALPNGDLLIGTSGTTIAIVPGAEAAGAAGAPHTFATIADDHAGGITFGSDANIYVGSDHGLWRIPYTPGATQAGAVTRLAGVRTGPVSPTTDGDVHSTTSVAVSGSTLYAGVGSSCNACTEVDPTRAGIAQLPLAGGSLLAKAQNFRNPIALTVDPANGTLWAGGAGQDALPAGHPYEKLDAVTTHAGLVNYGWPVCEDDLVPVAAAAAAACAGVTVPALIFPAYATLIGATFYPAVPTGAYAFPAKYRGGMFVTFHGSWHTIAGGLSAVAPQVVFVPMTSGAPSTAVDWTNPNRQWQPFFENFGNAASNRIGRPTGVTVGPRGSLFVADDAAGNIYRIRPVGPGTQAIRRVP